MPSDYGIQDVFVEKDMASAGKLQTLLGGRILKVQQLGRINVSCIMTVYQDDASAKKLKLMSSEACEYVTHLLSFGKRVKVTYRLKPLYKLFRSLGEVFSIEVLPDELPLVKN